MMHSDIDGDADAWCIAIIAAHSPVHWPYGAWAAHVGHIGHSDFDGDSSQRF